MNKKAMALGLALLSVTSVTLAADLTTTAVQTHPTQQRPMMGSGMRPPLGSGSKVRHVM